MKFLISLLLCCLTTSALAAPELLEPEKAFGVTAEAKDSKTISLHFAIEKGYYLYKHRFAFEPKDATLTLAPASYPAGERKQDEFFGEVEIFRGDLAVSVPVASGALGNGQQLSVTYQGCADVGVCYPPQTTLVTLGGAEGGGLLSRALGKLGARDEPAPAATAPAIAATVPVTADESGRLAGLLSTGKLSLILLSFFGAGLLLAFTPCMLPMLPILSGIIVGQGAHVTRARSTALAGVYVLGMALTYAVAGVAAGLSGTLLSAALQNAWVLGGFAAIFVVLAFAMFGFYELQLPSALQSRLSDRANHQRGGSVLGVAVMGVLSALIVGPCVAAPLAGALLYIAKTGDALLGGVALFVMALGMGAPLILVAVATRGLLPHAGPWMESVKRSFGVILLALALWLVTPVLPQVVVMLAWAALAIVCAVFLHALDPLPPQAKGARRFWKGVGVLLLIVGSALLIGALGGSRDPLQPLGFLRGATAAEANTKLPFQPVASVAELDARLAEGRPVMLDFYADWCVSCKEMERFTFSDPRVAAALKDTLLLKADVTGNTEAHQALLKRFGLFGPPGIVFFDAAGKEIDSSRVVGFQPVDGFLATLAARSAQKSGS
ncbi:protein-disulfide reductase DsbD [Niveibacterium microcysteis]|uniref:Thiol:disulfide interchange protein DsbD n=1 Tax=Niveibacterium microcysteis TaxID=2811415 RepID=A0ABX7M616_9RHOO|nr:protein-disulfide reductase DsbD [Niveibacterium microcysteis]QSI77198.1 protein-disulfide reductase DsbD [Niveibacterium microcysteis]